MGVFSIFMVLKTMILKETFQAESEKGGKKGIRGVPNKKRRCHGKQRMATKGGI